MKFLNKTCKTPIFLYLWNKLHCTEWTLTSDLRGCLHWREDWGHICSCTAAWLLAADVPYTHWTAGRCGSDTSQNASLDPSHTWQNTETRTHRTYKYLNWGLYLSTKQTLSSIKRPHSSYKPKAYLTSPHGPVTHWGGGQRWRLQRTLEVGRPCLGHFDSGSVSLFSPLLHKTTRCL